MSYLTTVLMGTPFQEVDMAPSLSQNFIAVATAPFGVSSNTYYNPATSTSYTPRNEVGTIPSITGQTVTGRFAGETCMLKATNSAAFGYNASVVLTNSSVSDDLYPVGARGVLGYGINAPTTSPPNSSLIPALVANATAAVCGIELNHMDDPVPDGIFTMGAVDPSAFSGDFTNVLVPPDSPISWAIPLDSLTYTSGGTTASLPSLIASIDLYHSVIQLTTAQASQIYAVIPGSQALSSNTWSLPCSSSFPITLTFGGKAFTLSERDTIVKLSNGSCQGVVTGGAQTVGKVGAPFMRNVYTQFGFTKYSNGTTNFFVGFATKLTRSAPSVVTTTLLSPTTVTAGGPSKTGTSSGTSGMAARDAILLSVMAIASVIAFIL
jgi:hypothetical protein